VEVILSKFLVEQFSETQARPSASAVLSAQTHVTSPAVQLEATMALPTHVDYDSNVSSTWTTISLGFIRKRTAQLDKLERSTSVELTSVAHQEHGNRANSTRAHFMAILLLGGIQRSPKGPGTCSRGGLHKIYESPETESKRNDSPARLPTQSRVEQSHRGSCSPHLDPPSERAFTQRFQLMGPEISRLPTAQAVVRSSNWATGMRSGRVGEAKSVTGASSSPGHRSGLGVTAACNRGWTLA
jgi:hypothetical protein